MLVRTEKSTCKIMITSGYAYIHLSDKVTCGSKAKPRKKCSASI